MTAEPEVTPLLDETLSGLALPPEGVPTAVRSLASGSRTLKCQHFGGIRQSTGEKLLDAVYQGLLNHEVHGALEELQNGLNQVRDAMFIDQWNRFVERHCLRHPLRKLLHQDPFTRHAFSCPRGCSGDAFLLDFLYGLNTPFPNVSSLGKAVFEFEYQTRSAQSVRLRRAFLAGEIDATAQRSPSAQIMAVCAGHLREVSLSRAVPEGRVGRLLALENDPVSLSLIKAQQKDTKSIQPVEGSIKTLLKHNCSIGQFDFIYAVGLFDYLPSSIAQRLTSAVFDHLKPGGQFLFANFLPTQPERGYMEAFMDWWIVRRNESELWDLVCEINPSSIGAYQIWPDPCSCFSYCQLAKTE